MIIFLPKRTHPKSLLIFPIRLLQFPQVIFCDIAYHFCSHVLGSRSSPCADISLSNNGSTALLPTQPEPIASRTRAGTSEPCDGSFIDDTRAVLNKSSDAVEAEDSEMPQRSSRTTRSRVKSHETIKKDIPRIASPITTRSGIKLQTPQPENQPNDSSEKPISPINAKEQESETTETTSPVVPKKPSRTRTTRGSTKGVPPTEKVDMELSHSVAASPSSSTVGRARRSAASADIMEPLITTRSLRHTRASTAEPIIEESEVDERASSRPSTRRTHKASDAPLKFVEDDENAQPNQEVLRAVAKSSKRLERAPIAASSPIRGSSTQPTSSLKRRHVETSPPKRSLRSRPI
jgi:hypothetical protein